MHLGFVHVTQGKLHPHGGATDTASSKGCSEGILCTQPALKWGCDSEMGAQSPGRWTPPGHRGQGASHPEALGGTGVVFTLKVPRPLCTFENVVDKTLMSKNFERIEPPHVQAWLFLLPVSSGTVRRRWALEQVQEKKEVHNRPFPILLKRPAVVTRPKAGLKRLEFDRRSATTAVARR